jgi:hypothetical protein
MWSFLPLAKRGQQISGANYIHVVRPLYWCATTPPVVMTADPPPDSHRSRTMDAANALSSGDTAGELSERDREILNFERQWWKYAGAKEQAVREKFAMSSTRYYQVLNALIDRPDALAFDPLLVRRLRRLRAARQRARSARRLGFEV